MSRPRRDPRAEAARRTVAGGARPRSTIEIAVVTTAGGRPRRDPRAELVALVVPAPRRRIDRSLAAGVAVTAVANLSATAADVASTAIGTSASRAIRTIGAPACFVFVVPDAPGGRAGAHDRQLLGAARLLADAGGGAVVVLADGGDWGALGADRVLLPPAGDGSRPSDKAATLPSPLAGEGREGGRHDPGVAWAAPPLPTIPREEGGAPQAGSDEGGVHSRSRSEALSGVASYDPEARAAAIVAAIRAVAPRHVVFAETAEGGDIARRVAAGLGEPLFAGAESVTARTVTRPAKAGRVEQRMAPPRLLSLLPDIVAPHGGPPHEARPVTLAELAAEPAPAPRERLDFNGAEGVDACGGNPPVEGGEARGGAAPESAIPAPRARGILSAETIPADPASLPLAEAGFVVSAGNGVSDFDGFRALVAALGATPGASRVVCDAGLMPRDRQVGASGTVLDATCYFALGIAGAPQHLQGVAKCEHVVAVNTDLHAAMIERAGLAVVADAQKVMPALAALLAAERGGAGATTGPAAAPRSGDAGDANARTSDGEDRKSDGGVAALAGPETVAATVPLSLRARVLLSAGRHPVSGRPAPVRAEAQATALALSLGADVRGLHAGGEAAAVADHLGHGLDAIDIAVGPSAVTDPLPALVTALSRTPVDLVLAGRRGVGSDDSGLLPYRLAAALGLPLVADAVALAREPGRPEVLVVDQALPRGARRRVRVTLPAVVTVHPAAPPPKPFAFAAVRRGSLVPLALEATAGEPALAVEERPWRRRPRLIAGTATAGTAAERLKAATEVAGGGGRLLVDPDPAEAAREILAFLRGIGVVAPKAS